MFPYYAVVHNEVAPILGPSRFDSEVDYGKLRELTDPLAASSSKVRLVQLKRAIETTPGCD